MLLLQLLTRLTYVYDGVVLRAWFVMVTDVYHSASREDEITKES